MKYLSIILILTILFAACAQTTQGDATKSLQLDKKITPRPPTTQPIVIPEEITNEVPIGDNLGDYFGRNGILGPKSLSFLGAGFVNANGISSSYQEKIAFSRSALIGPHTALTMAYQDSLEISSDDSEAFGREIFIPASPSSMEYYIEFGNPSIFQNTPFNIQFLGRDLEIMGTGSDSIRVRTAEMFTLNAGESVSVDGKVATLVRTTGGNTTAFVNSSANFFFNGTNETLSFSLMEGESISVQGSLVFVENVFDDEGIMFDSVLINTIINGSNTSHILSAGQSIPLANGFLIFIDVDSASAPVYSTPTAVIDVDGEVDIVRLHEEKPINGLYIQVEDIINYDGIEQDSATLLIGNSRTEVEYSNRDPYIGQDVDDPTWEWNIDLNRGILGVKWALDIDRPDENNNPEYSRPIYAGEEYLFPHAFAAVKFEGMNIPYDYQTAEGYNLLRFGVTSTINVSYNDSYSEVVPHLIRVNSFYYAPTKGLIVNGIHTSEAYLFTKNGQLNMAYIDRTRGSPGVGGAYYQHVPVSNNGVLFQIVSDELTYNFVSRGIDRFAYEIPDGEYLEISPTIVNGSNSSGFVQYSMQNAAFLHKVSDASVAISTSRRETDYTSQFGMIVKNPAYSTGNYFSASDVFIPKNQVKGIVKVYQPNFVAPPADPVPIDEDPIIRME